MKQLALMLVAAFLLAGCQTTTPKIDSQQLVLIEIPNSLYNCQLPPKPPAAATLTNRQIANYIDILYKRLVECNVNMEKIKLFVEQSKRSLEAKQKK